MYLCLVPLCYVCLDYSHPAELAIGGNNYYFFLYILLVVWLFRGFIKLWNWISCIPIFGGGKDNCNPFDIGTVVDMETHTDLMEMKR